MSRYPIPQRLIDRCTRTANAFADAQAELLDLCRQKYGHEPGDIDAAQILDSVLGAAGKSNGMTAKEFDEEMLACLSREGLIP